MPLHLSSKVWQALPRAKAPSSPVGHMPALQVEQYEAEMELMLRETSEKLAYYKAQVRALPAAAGPPPSKYPSAF